MNITIENTSIDGLQQECWTFYVRADHNADNIRVIYDSYQLLQRPTTRHKLRIRSSWKRLGGRVVCKTVFEPLDRAPEVPEDVLARARVRVSDSIQFILTPDRQ